MISFVVPLLPKMAAHPARRMSRVKQEKLPEDGDVPEDDDGGQRAAECAQQIVEPPALAPPASKSSRFAARKLLIASRKHCKYCGGIRLFPARRLQSRTRSPDRLIFR